MIFRTLIAAALMVVLSLPAQAQECTKLLTVLETFEKSFEKIESYPLTEMQEAAFKETVKELFGGESSADTVVVIEAGGWKKVRVVGFINGCMEAGITIPKKDLGKWVGGKPA